MKIADITGQSLTASLSASSSTALRTNRAANLSATLLRLPQRVGPSETRSADAAHPKKNVGGDAIRFQGVSKHFGSQGGITTALQDISLAVPRGQFTALVGPSGCGKTTLLNLAAGLMLPDTGTVFYQGAPLRQVNTQVGYMTQDDALLPWRSVLANVTLPLEVRRVPKREREAAAALALEQVGLTGFARHFPAQLSGGMKKRVALARTLVYHPETLLLDEPFSALDAHTRVSIHAQLKELVSRLGITVLLVTHDLDEAIGLSDRIAVFSARPARLLETVRLPPRMPDNLTRRSAADAEVLARLWQHLADPGAAVASPAVFKPGGQAS